jgi:hypothetical protein
MFKNQILSFVIDIISNEKGISTKNVAKFVFIQILTMFTNLQFLCFGPSFIYQQRLSFFDNSFPIVFSSTLLELRVGLQTFRDCLYLLDGCFDQLRTFHVKISLIYGSNKPINNKVDFLAYNQFNGMNDTFLGKST